ncbi:MAG: PaaI family thioesterase [Actinobacteria bacterium]|nr:PaaI family thioesterase [Actinomycetota bacterium]
MRQTVDPADPANTCWGCSPHNHTGLQLRFEPLDERTVRSTYRAPEHQCGREHTVHGGIQAAVLDEVMGAALGLLLPPPLACATAELQVRFRRAARTEIVLTVEARVVEESPPHYVVEATLSDDVGICTTARARWRVLDG